MTCLRTQLNGLLLCFYACSLIACIDSGQERFEFPLSVAGTELAETTTGRDGWQISLEQANLAFGPLYLCAGAQAGELCQSARAEWLSSVVIDLLSSESKFAGDMDALSGEVRSFMYDLGYSSLLTQQASLELDAAEELGGHSVVLRGQATQAQTVLPFEMQLVLTQDSENEQGVPIVRSSTNDSFTQQLRPGLSLTVRFDAGSWLHAVDFTAIAKEQNCENATCSMQNFSPDSQAARAIRSAILAGRRPVLEWE